MPDPALPTRTWADVSLRTIAENYRRLCARVPAGDAVAAVVKADAYGHGLLPVARVCVDAGARHLAVATIDEALALRGAKIGAEIAILAPLLPEDLPTVLEHDFVPFVSSRAFLRDAPPNRTLHCWVAVDTGMGREGFAPDDAARLFADPPKGIRIEGFSTHFACADEDDPTPTDLQVSTFHNFLEHLGPAAQGLWRSCANSPGMLRAARPDGGPVLWRPGALLYGIAPFPGADHDIGVHAALTWRARITLIREHPAGAAIGYGRTAILSRPSRIATLAAGYADGLSRRLSNRGQVLVRGRRCPIVGRVSMDQCQIDVTDLDTATVGEVATLLGSDGNARISAEEVAAWIGTTVHEPTTTIAGRVPRRFDTD